MRDRGRGYAHRVDIVADAEQVWRALTEPEHLSRWCSPGAQIRAQKGGLFRASVDRVTELPIVDDFILDAKGPTNAPDGTILRLLGSGIPATEEWNRQYQRLKLGWQQAMTRLKVFTEKQLRSQTS